MNKKEKEIIQNYEKELFDKLEQYEKVFGFCDNDTNMYRSKWASVHKLMVLLIK